MSQGIQPAIIPTHIPVCEKFCEGHGETTAGVCVFVYDLWVCNDCEATFLGGVEGPGTFSDGVDVGDLLDPKEEEDPEEMEDGMRGEGATKRADSGEE